MIELTSSLLERSPEETSRVLCLGLLDDADAALGRLERNEDQEALHDFRVALRRLRSVMRSYRPYLRGSARKKLRARLKKLASSTSGARDLEVQISFLSERAAVENESDPLGREGATRLLSRLRAAEPAPASAASLRETFDSLHRALRKSLSRLRLDLEKEGPSFLGATGALVAESASRLSRSLKSVSSAEDGELLHRSRIEAKRLRYLLEPLMSGIARGHSLVKELKGLQDLLGELQDIRVLMQSISDELERSALEQAHRVRDLALREGAIPAEGLTPDRGLLALLREVRERRDRRYRELSQGWLSDAREAFFQQVLGFASELSAAFGSSKPMRRFLLSSIPKEARGRRAAFVRQGFLPGRRIREQIRSVQSGARTRYVREIATSRFPVEESLRRESFEALWPVVPMRLERARYEVREKDRTFWIDELEDPKLVLVETEESSDLALPEWLKEVLVREVTGSKAYEWEALARRKASSDRLKKRARSAPERPDDPRDEAR